MLGRRYESQRLRQPPVALDCSASRRALSRQPAQRKPVVGKPPVVNDPATAKLFINRELSWLGFNERVLEEARDPTVPLVERLKFVAIVASNLDEFFMVRVAGLKQQLSGNVAETPPDGLTAAEQLAAISTRAHAMVAELYRAWRDDIEPGLARRRASGGSRPRELTPEQKAHLSALLRARGLAGADAAGGRSRPPVPDAAQPQPEPGGVHAPREGQDRPPRDRGRRRPGAVGAPAHHRGAAAARGGTSEATACRPPARRASPTCCSRI